MPGYSGHDIYSDKLCKLLKIFEMTKVVTVIFVPSEKTGNNDYSHFTIIIIIWQTSSNNVFALPEVLLLLLVLLLFVY